MEIHMKLEEKVASFKHMESALVYQGGLLANLGTIPVLVSKGGNGSIFIIALVMMGVSFVFNIMILGVNRMRESYADVNSTQTIPGGAENLQTALAKIVASTPQKKHLRKSAGSSTSSMLMF